MWAWCKFIYQMHKFNNQQCLVMILVNTDVGLVGGPDGETTIMRMSWWTWHLLCKSDYDLFCVCGTVFCKGVMMTYTHTLVLWLVQQSCLHELKCISAYDKHSWYFMGRCGLEYQLLHKFPAHSFPLVHKHHMVTWPSWHNQTDVLHYLLLHMLHTGSWLSCWKSKGLRPVSWIQNEMSVTNWLTITATNAIWMVIS